MQPKKRYSPTRKHWTRLTIRKYGSENSYSLLLMNRAQDSAHHRNTIFSAYYPVLANVASPFFFYCRCSVAIQGQLRASRRDTAHAPRPKLYTPQPFHFQQQTRSTTITPQTTNIHTSTMPPVTTLLPILLLLLFFSIFGYVGYQVRLHLSLLPPQ